MTHPATTLPAQILRNLDAVKRDGAEDAIESLRKIVDAAISEADCAADDIPARHKSNLADVAMGLHQAREAIERMR